MDTHEAASTGDPARKLAQFKERAETLRALNRTLPLSSKQPLQQDILDLSAHLTDWCYENQFPQSDPRVIEIFSILRDIR